jgi:hypothetical protein
MKSRQMATADGDGRRQSDGIFFFVKTGFSSIKNPNSSRKSIKNFFFEITKSILHNNFVKKQKFLFRYMLYRSQIGSESVHDKLIG